MNADLYTHMQEAAGYLRAQGIGKVDLGLILGSGLRDVDQSLEDKIEIPYQDIPHLSISGAPGHRGVVAYGRLGKTRVLIFSGRIHYYEGYPLWQVTFTMRIMQALGVPRAILTAAVGGLSDGLTTGDILLVTDHLNLLPDNPLRGISDPRLGERFTDLSAAYDPEWAAHIERTAESLGLTLKKGVYACLQGPSLETQAECAYLRTCHADVVGMSVVPEVIVGVQAGIRMAALVVVANMAWHPETGTGATVTEILTNAADAAPRLTKLLTGITQNGI